MEGGMVTERDGFITAFKDTYTIDGCIFKIDTSSWDIRNSVVERFKETLVKGLKLTPEDMKAHVHIKFFNMSKDSNRAIVRIQLTGWPANHAPDLFGNYVHDLTELHLKSFIVGVPSGDSELQLQRELLESESGQQLTLFGGTSSYAGNKRKGTGRGIRIGSRKSDYNFVLYRRAGERMGLEVRVKDAAMLRARDKAIAAYTSGDVTGRSAFDAVVKAVSVIGATQFYNDLTLKGIAIGKIAMHLTDTAEDAAIKFIASDCATGASGMYNSDTHYFDA
jgi:hypothetical protein